MLDIEKVTTTIEEFLSPLLKAARLNLQFRIRPAPEGDSKLPKSNSGSESQLPLVTVDFSGPDTDLLLARGGELLEALEELTVRVLRLPLDDRSSISFDSGDFKSLRVEELRLTAETAAEMVQSSGRPFRLNPMNSRERRIIHLSLKDNPAVRTESEGFGSRRNVVILPAEKK